MKFPDYQKKIIIIIKKRKKNLILRNSSEGYNKRNYVLKNLEKGN